MEQHRENTEDRQYKSEPTKKKDRTPLFIGLFALLLAILIFFYYQNVTLKKEREAQTRKLSDTILQLDSISGELDQRILTIQQLGGEIDTLMKIREDLQTERKLLLTEIKNRKNMISTIQGKVDGYQELLLIKDEEIKQLKQMNDQLITENNTLKTEKQELSESIQEINKEKDKLAEQVAFASRLKIEGLKVYAVNEDGKEREGEFRNRHIDQLKITFTVAENKVAPIEGKDLLIRIVAPNGNVLFDVTRGSGSFVFENRDIFYSAKHEILYDKKNQQVSVFYKKGNEYAEGRHQVEVYTDDYLMGKGTFLVK